MPAANMTNIGATDDNSPRSLTQDADVSISAAADPAKFVANDRRNTRPDLTLPDELWLTILDSPCTFRPENFEHVMLNLVKNPNVTSSHLFRADIFYDSSKDHLLNGQGSGLEKHLKQEYRPKPFELQGWQIDRTIVRQLIPRNVQLDAPLVQTCIFLSRHTHDDRQDSLVVYIPHIDSPDNMPFYHPRVEKLAFHHSYQPSPLNPEQGTGSISVSYKPFAEHPVDQKLHRTGLKLLQTVHKHGQGQLAGYEKRVHLDQIIPQKRYQDTYARLKAKYGRKLSEAWVEVTDPGKHVFEDLGIAAFLLELWEDMYALPELVKIARQTDDALAGAERDREALQTTEIAMDGVSLKEDAGSATNGHPKPDFPGFVDIGCGNGLLVNILVSEGYPGFGFDARERKTWSTFAPQVRQHLSQQLLVPDVLRPATVSPEGATEKRWHDGTFEPGTFIISNHADELTAWTPLLAHLNQSAFLALPCCSHDLAGKRFRAPEVTKAEKATKTSSQPAPRLPQQELSRADGPQADNKHLTQAAETGSLKRTLVQKKMASAYSTLCSYVVSLSRTIGFDDPEKEVLRIPSTRNQSIIGRRRRDAGPFEDLGQRRQKVVRLVEEELGRSLVEIGQEWVERAEKLAKKPGSGH